MYWSEIMILLVLLLLPPLLLFFLFFMKLESRNGRWCQTSTVVLYIGRVMTKKWWFYLTHKDRQLASRRRKKSYSLGEHWRKSEQRNRLRSNENIMNLKTIGNHSLKIIRYGDFFYSVLFFLTFLRVEERNNCLGIAR